MLSVYDRQDAAVGLQPSRLRRFRTWHIMGVFFETAFSIR